MINCGWEYEYEITVIKYDTLTAIFSLSLILSHDARESDTSVAMIEFVDKLPKSETGVQVDEDALGFGRVLLLTGLPFVTSYAATAPLRPDSLYFN